MRSRITIAALLLLSQAPVAATQTSTSTDKIVGVASQNENRDREQGSAGIDRFLKMNGAELARLRTQTDNPRWKELNTTLDRICKQRDCGAARKSLNNPPTADEAGGIAISKMAIESPILQLSRAFSRRSDILKKATDDPLWVKLGELHQEDAILAENSRQLIRRKQPQLASLNAQDRGNNTDPLPELVNRFQKLIAIDSIRNEYLLHSQLHQWLMGK